MSLIDFIQALEEPHEEFDADSEQAADSDDASSGGRSLVRLVVVALLLAGVAYVVYRLRSSADSELLSDIELAEFDADSEASEAADKATVSVEHDPDDASDVEASEDETGETGETDELDEESAVEVEIESPDDEADEDDA
ncbi:hypothetical protein [Haloferax sp. DFSO52]|uniref:hypothetical protein n=1 Tax=Haloferax sp. DFSO52 TaxID=3388505 RepID=UPI003A845A1E